MRLLLPFLLVASLGSALYHVGQKALNPQANPVLVLMTVYGIAFLATAAALPFMPVTPGTPRLALTWPVVLMGLSIVLIEAGFLLAYRQGGSLHWSGVAVNVAAAILVLPPALIVFRETLTPSRLLGMLLALAGLALMVRK